MSKARASKTSPARKVITKRQEKQKIMISDLANGKVKRNVGDFDSKEGGLYRWTPSLANTAEKQGKFILIGVAPAAQKATVSQKKKSLNPPFVSAGKLETVLDPEKGVEGRYSDKNYLWTSFDVLELADAYPDYYDNDVKEKSVYIPLYVVSTESNLMKQLNLQGIIPDALYNDDEDFYSIIDIFYKKAVVASKPDDKSGILTIQEWSKTKTYDEILERTKTEKKAELSNFKQDDILKVAYLKNAKNAHNLEVLDVNKTRVAYFPAPPSKSITNDFADYFVGVIEDIKSKTADSDAFDTAFAKVAFDISEMKDPRNAKVKKIKAHKEGETSTSLKIPVRLDGFSISVEGKTYKLGNKIHTDNEDAIRQLFAEVDAVVAYSKQGRGHNYKYTKPGIGAEGAVTIFSKNFGAVYAKQNKKAAEEVTIFPGAY